MTLVEDWLRIVAWHRGMWSGDARVTAKTINNGGVNEHIRKAFHQLLGDSGEIPKLGSKLIAEVHIFSSKCYWPFNLTDYRNIAPTKKQFEDKLGDVASTISNLFTQTINEKLINVNTGPPRKRKRDEAGSKPTKTKAQERKEAQRKFLEAMQDIQMKLVVKYRKNVDSGNKVFKERSSEGGINSVAVNFSATGGLVNPRMEMRGISIK